MRHRVVCLAAIAALFLTVSAAVGQRRAHRPPPTVARARAMFAEAREAWVALLALDVQPADANGAVRGWDRR